MNQVTPAIRDLARRLLALETREGERAEAGMRAAMTTITKLSACLTKLAGVAGVQALLARALALAKAEVGWLEPVHVGADATFEGFDAAAQGQSAVMAAQGSVTLVAQLLGLLVTFIGLSLTLRVVQDVWPAVELDDMNSVAEETRE